MRQFTQNNNTGKNDSCVSFTAVSHRRPSRKRSQHRLYYHHPIFQMGMFLWRNRKVQSRPLHTDVERQEPRWES